MIADYAAFIAQLQQGISVSWAKDGMNASEYMSLWQSLPDPGATPVNAACSVATRGALHFSGASTARLLGAEVWSVDENGTCSIIVSDRLSHTGGLSGTSVAVQTTNLPTAALTRYTSGVGVHAALEVYTAVGAAQQDATVSYTNQAGVAGRTGLARLGNTGASGRGNQGAVSPIALQAGDYGVRSVESVQLALSTGTVGNFGVVLYRPLFVISQIPGRPTTSKGTTMKVVHNTFLNGGCMPQLASGCCLWLVQRNTGIGNDATRGKLVVGVEP